MLKVQLLAPGAIAPTVAHPGEDLGYDLYALEAITLPPQGHAKVRTGIAVEARHPHSGEPLGLLVRDRSSVAGKGVFATAGVIDAGYRGEILILLTNQSACPFPIEAGHKIAQIIPMPVLTGPVTIAESLEESSRGGKGFGSSGR
jgi:dUTP pyrophosphatase